MRRRCLICIAPLRAALVSLAALIAPAALAAGPPAQAVQRLAGAYSQRSVAGIDALLTGDFRFHFSDNDSARGAFVDGLPREDELEACRAMFEGSNWAPRATSITVNLGALDEGIDPEHPDSCQFRLVVAHDFRMTFTIPNGEWFTILQAAGGLQVFHVVRGDVAVLAPGQTADPARWYVRRWIEDVDGLTISLAQVDGECADEGALSRGAPTGTDASRIGLRALDVPLCPTLKLLLDLPGNEPARLEVYDVQGRRVANRTIPVHGPGALLVEAGNGKRFTPGVYWLRLYQGTRPPAKRMVVVAR